MSTAPQIVVIVGPDGTVEDVSVFAKDHASRILGFHLIEALSAELEVFEARAKIALGKLREAH
jgi:hypothetical protein